MICGTPVLTPNFGGFINTVKRGITGYLCGSNDWIENIQKIQDLNSNDSENMH